jgi:general secretion pathway protein E
MLIGELLKKHGLISEEQWVSAAAEARTDEPTSLIDILVDRHGLKEIQILQVLANHFVCDVLEAVDRDMLDASLVHDLPVEFARTRLMLPVRHQGEVHILTNDPAAVIEQNDLSLLLQVEPIPLLAPKHLILEAIETCYFSKQHSSGTLIANMETNSPAAPSSDRSSDLLRSSEQAPVTQLVNQILLDALKEGASDIHIEPFDKTMRVRFRLDGVMYDRPAPPKSMEAALSSRLKIMARLDIAEKRLPQDGMARVNVGEREIDVRMSTVPVAEGERIVLRLLRHDTTHLSMSELGMPASVLEPFRTLLREPHGVIWVTGPTGSGKTTSLYAALQELDTDRRNVMTIEDPVEYQLPRIGQIGVKPDIGLTFARGLRHILRQDPDIILVGETRDIETAEIVVQASLTGHLVFSTLHTNDALSAVVRLTDMGVEPFLLAESTRATMAQRLVRRLCPHCKVEETESDVIASLGALSEGLEGKTRYRAVGCDQCREGFSGRVGIYELHLINERMQGAIRQNQGLEELRGLSAEQGTETLWHDALNKVALGLTSLDEVRSILGAPSAT